MTTKGVENTAQYKHKASVLRGLKTGGVGKRQSFLQFLFSDRRCLSPFRKEHSVSKSHYLLDSHKTMKIVSCSAVFNCHPSLGSVTKINRISRNSNRESCN